MYGEQRRCRVGIGSSHFAGISKKGSILLYVLFLSSFLVLFSVSFQGELEKMLEGAKNSEKSMEDISRVQDALILLKNAPTARVVIDTNKNLSLVSLYQSGTVFTESLGGDSPQEYWLTSTGGANSITLNIALGGPVMYHIAAFNSGSEATSVLISSGVIATNGIIPLSSSQSTHILVIDPLGGYVQYALDKKTTTTIPASSSYRLESSTNGYKKDEGIYDIINFVPKSRSDFDYGKMGMYLK
ncbi:TPA: hypothetical protein DCZ36_00795 [Candidatus Gracilibacteria bacterium]|nr:hypothetical protein [Candidatus Gracilibacteria bacterium]